MNRLIWLALTAIVVIAGCAALPGVQVGTDSLPSAIVQQTYSAKLTAIGGIPPYRWSIVSGQLPLGMTLSISSGEISGTAVSAGDFDFTVGVADAQVYSPQVATSRRFKLKVNANARAQNSPLVISTTTLSNGTQQVPYSATLAASGGTSPYGWSVAAGSLPPGLTLSASTGSIAGPPTASGQYSFTVQAADSAAQPQSVTKALSISIAAPAPAPLQISTSSLPSGQVQVSYSVTLAGTGGTSPYSWSVVTGSLPPGLTLGSSTGAIAGTPTASGQYSFTVQATDSAAQPQSVTKALSISIAAPAPAPLQISTSSLPSGQVQVSYSVTLAGTGGTSPYSWSVAAGSLPPGLTLGAATGAIAGTPSSSGQYSFVVQIQDSAASPQTALQSLTLTINAAPVSLAVSPTSASLQPGQSQQFTATVTGTTNTAVTWSVNSISGGNSTVGTISSAGLYTAPATISSSITVTVTATSVADTSTSRSASVTVNLPPPPPPPSGGVAELPRVYIDTTMPDTTGYAVVQVNAGGDLQAAINNASCGTIIKLQAGATFTGNFNLPNKPCDSTHWIIIRSNTADSNLPPQGTRVSPAYASFMPKIQSSNALQAVLTAYGANHYWFFGVEVTTTSFGTGITLYDLFELGDGSAASTSQIPHDIVIDRTYVHGDPVSNIRRCVAMNAASSAVVDSYLSDCHEVGADAQAIGGWGTPGPVKIVNNYLEGSGENFILGGALPALQSAEVAYDVEFRRNYCFKPLKWRVGDPSYAGIHWSIKNNFELKSAARVLIDGNIFENDWEDGQNGIAVLFTPRSYQSGPNAVVNDITFTNNIVRHAGGGVNILGHDDLDTSIPANLIQAKRILIQGNLFIDINSATWGGDGRFVQLLLGASSVVVNHNTAFQNGNVLTFATMGWTFPNFVYQNNITSHGSYGVIGDSTAPGTPTLSTYAPGYMFTSNVIEASPSGEPYPANNFFPATWAEVGFVNYSGGDYHLSSSSPYHNAATDGTDIGANINAVTAATNGVAVR